MTHESLVNRDWKHVIGQLGGPASLESSARETKAFLRARAIENAVDLLRIILAYCLGERGLRSTAAWASAVGLVDMSNVALRRFVLQDGGLLFDEDSAPKPIDSEHRRLPALLPANNYHGADVAGLDRPRICSSAGDGLEATSRRFSAPNIEHPTIGGARFARLPPQPQPRP